MAETENRHEQALFAETFEGMASKEGYLGRVDDVEALLRTAALAVLEAKTSDVEKVSGEQAIHIAKELLGEGKMAPVSGWNEAGAIDVFAKPYAVVTGNDPHEVMSALFFEMINELSDVAQLADTPGILPEQWEWQVGATYETYRNIAMGCHPRKESPGDEDGETEHSNKAEREDT